MKYIVKVQFKTDIQSSFVAEGSFTEAVAEEIHKDAEEDQLENFKIVSIEPFITVEGTNSVN